MLLLATGVQAATPGPWEGLASSDVAARFLAADAARDDKDYLLAERRYRALIAENQGELRIEARFRLAMMLDGLGRQGDGARELQAILAEKPDAQGIRVVLARMLAQSGQGEAARRAFREAEESGLPPEVQAVVRQYVAALRSEKPVGGSLNLTLVADSNVNRATHADTLDTVIAPFQLSEDARAQAGVGGSIAGQFYARLPLANSVKLITRLSGQGDIYNKPQFNDIRGGGQIGLEWTTRKDRLVPSIGRSYRWFGGARYATSDTVSLSWRHKAGARAVIDGTLSAGKADYARNDGLDGGVYDVSLRYERAFSARRGAAITLSAQRLAAADPGYATTAGGIELFYWQQAGKLTLTASLAASHLEADARQLLFPDRRSDWLASAAVGASLPEAQIAGFYPLLRASYVRNSSSVSLFDYARARIELGLARSF